MATTLVTAFSKPTPPPLVLFLHLPFRVKLCLADLQGKFFTQIEQLHKQFDCGALTKEQFKKCKWVIWDRLDELANI